jgi:hypothetical protein
LPINQIGASLVALTTMPRAAKLFQTSLPIGRPQTAELNQSPAAFFHEPPGRSKYVIELDRVRDPHRLDPSVAELQR